MLRKLCRRKIRAWLSTMATLFAAVPQHHHEPVDFDRLADMIVDRLLPRGVEAKRRTRSTRFCALMRAATQGDDLHQKHRQYAKDASCAAASLGALSRLLASAAAQDCNGIEQVLLDSLQELGDATGVLLSPTARPAGLYISQLLGGSVERLDDMLHVLGEVVKLAADSSYEKRGLLRTHIALFAVRAAAARGGACGAAVPDSRAGAADGGEACAWGAWRAHAHMLPS